MMLALGTRLGPYEIQAPLGAGGMGEVYRARDSRLDRDVAVKILPAHVADAPDALARFEREARALAAPSHPNILAVHDVGTDGQTSYIVMELLEGETLRARLTRSSLPWQKAVAIGAAVADGLSAAHAKGLTHRDLKPENVFLTADGRVKLLDFGLASDRATSLPTVDSAPTVAAVTQPGVVMGTVDYMSPEQVRGEVAGPRSDIFSFGCVFYEMVTGRRPFTHRTTAETMAAILSYEPPSIESSETAIPPDLVQVLTRCLEKNPEQRFQSASDLGFALTNLLRRAAPRSLVQIPGRRVAAGVAAALLILVIVLTGYWAVTRTRPADQAIDSLAILPLTNENASVDTEYLADGVTETLINTLSQLPQLRVMARTTVFRYKGRQVDPQEVGRELGVRAVFTGRIVQRADTVSIQADLVDVESGAQLWGERYNRRLADLLNVPEEIALRMAEGLRLRLTGDDGSD